MTDVTLMKGPGGMLVPCDEGAREFIDKMKAGAGCRATIRKVRNIRFHRKFFAMLQVGFDAWEPPEQTHRGLPVQKNFERFRKDVTIAAGFYEPVSNLKGEVRAEAASISFSNMDDAEFERVYSAVADVLLQKVLTQYTREDLDRVVEQMQGFL